MDRFLLVHCPPFEHFTEEELTPMRYALQAKKSVYQKDSFVFSAGDPAVYIGVVLSGKVHVIQEDYWGNRSILTSLLPGELFGEAFACAQVEVFPVSVMASEPSSVLLLDYRNMFTAHATSYSFYAKLAQNMTKILAKKNIMLTGKIRHITRRSNRAKILSYLSSQAEMRGSNPFTLPFNRQKLADYLSIDRSSLSRELSSMQNDGLIQFQKSTFHLLRNEENF